MGGTSWFSRAFSRASKSKEGRTVKKSERERAVEAVEAAAAARGGAAREADAARADAATELGRDAKRRMRVEDFEPLKLIGRGAFGACAMGEGDGATDDATTENIPRRDERLTRRARGRWRRRGATGETEGYGRDFCDEETEKVRDGSTRTG